LRRANQTRRQDCEWGGEISSALYDQRQNAAAAAFSAGSMMQASGMFSSQAPNMTVARIMIYLRFSPGSVEASGEDFSFDAVIR